MKVGILYHRFLDDKGVNRTIGGIQTYIYSLANLFIEKGWEPIIFQCSEIEFDCFVNNIKVVGVPRNSRNTQRNILSLYVKAGEYLDYESDIVIFGADHCSIRTKNKRCISIQHGISWDMPANELRPGSLFVRSALGKWFWKLKVIRDAISYFDNCSNRVCVDYNFLNWYKAIIPGLLIGNAWVIPNFSAISSEMLVNSTHSPVDTIKILFARRFTEYRGSRIMVMAATRILNEYKNVEFTFAGEGPDESWMRQLVGNDNRVRFIKYLPDEAVKIHAMHHISIIPSLASEGTSLSIVEAMSVGSAVIASSVGGITNMIIDGYNGIMLSPTEENIYLAIKFYINHPEERNKMAKCGYEVAKNAFDRNKWNEKWTSVIESVNRISN